MASMRNDLFVLISLLLLSFPASRTAATNGTSATSHDAFPRCFLHHTASLNASHLLYTSNTASYFAVFRSSVQNPRFLSPGTNKPVFIVTPTLPSHAQAAVVCARAHGLRLRVRSGGHDYEGASYVSASADPFLVLDLANLRAVAVNATDGTAWVGAGATLGEVYYNIAASSPTAGFPAGTCPTVGVGGHFSGGGIGMLLRKYGTAADNVVDAVMVDVGGRVLDRGDMGEDLFWAIRGGGAASFGVVLAYKVRLVHVAPTVTVFAINRTLQQGATELIHKWQHVAPNYGDDLSIRIRIVAIDDTESKGNRTVQAIFECLFLGEGEELLGVLGETFPELGVEAGDCEEMSWIDSVVFFAGYSNQSSSVLLDRRPQFNLSFKAKSDFVREPISAAGWRTIWRFLERSVGEAVGVILDPWKGRMDEIAEDAIGFPHRRGNLYNIQYTSWWSEAGEAVAERHLRWMRKLYQFMAPYVSSNPRAAYLNYKDFDLGRNNIDEQGDGRSCAKARVWARPYFLNNFERLAKVKAQVDPADFFWNEQSIPPYSLANKKLVN